MAFLEYMLLALLGSASATPAGTPAPTFTADAVTQPSGGTEGEGAGIGLLGQCTGRSGGAKQAGTGRKSVRHLEAARHHRSGHRHSKVTGTGSKVSSSTGSTGGVKPNMNAQPRPPRPRRASNSNKNSK